jgi:hypothetical protein
MLPPRRPIVQASAERALYFAAADKPSQPLRRRDPFAQLRPAEVVFPPPRP